MSTQNNTNNNRTQRRRKRRFTIPTTTRQFQTCLQRLSLKGLSCLFFIADHAMYLLGPLLIALASVIIVGLTYLYFCVMLPMMAGTNWIVTVDDYLSYKNGGGHHAALSSSAAAEVERQSNEVENISTIQSILLAVATPTGIFHTAIVAFYLINVTYNYYKCVTTSNSGKVYDSVVRELAAVTNFDYPENDEELLQCKRALEQKIAAKLETRRRELLAARANNNDASSTQQPQPIPRIHNWQLLTPTEWSYCRFSKQPKPPRSHYDHVTKSLVLNMDHYCPWMFNCVGYFNYRYFVNFLFFTTTGLFYGAMICCRPFLYLGGSEYREQVRASTSSGGSGVAKASSLRGAMMATVRHLESNSYIPTPNERTSVALGFMICVCLGCAVGCLLVFHLYLTVSAQTTIEFHGNWAKRRKKKGWKNPYSAGSWKRNWEMIYGTRYHFQRGNNINYDEEENGGVDVTNHRDDQYSYRGCWNMLVAMMPSKREPEFLPFPFDGVLIRRKNRVNSSLEVDKKMDEEIAEAESSCPGLHLSMDNGGDDDEDDDVIGVFKKKSSSRTATDSLIESNNSNGLTDRAGRNTPRGEELMV
mmetsp:Transcript_1855/g.3393  ORF Transcript_1855/g.3393 Transcript_1855/m.3393 type:complete len:587 (-) Transcript_1855:99-1859(-)